MLRSTGHYEHKRIQEQYSPIRCLSKPGKRLDWSDNHLEQILESSCWRGEDERTQKSSMHSILNTIQSLVHAFSKRRDSRQELHEERDERAAIRCQIQHRWMLEKESFELTLIGRSYGKAKLSNSKWTLMRSEIDQWLTYTTNISISNYNV